MTTAWQADSFQNDAFQIEQIDDGGGGGKKWLIKGRGRRNRHGSEDRNVIIDEIEKRLHSENNSRQREEQTKTRESLERKQARLDEVMAMSRAMREAEIIAIMQKETITREDDYILVLLLVMASI